MCAINGHFRSNGYRRVLRKLQELSGAIGRFFRRFLHFLVHFGSNSPLVRVRFLQLVYGVYKQGGYVHPSVGKDLGLFNQYFSPNFFRHFIGRLTMRVVSGHLRIATLFDSRRVSNSPSLRIPRNGLGSTTRVQVLPSNDRSFFHRLFRRFISTMRGGHVHHAVKSTSPPTRLVRLKGPRVVHIVGSRNVSV